MLEKALSRITVLLLTMAAFACTDDDPVEIEVGSLRLIGQQVLARRLDFMGTTVGGLSGIDYDAANDRFVLVSDDRTTNDSDDDPRMYTARLDYDAASFDGVELLSTFEMQQPSGQPYPKVPDPAVADPEGVRIDPATGNLVWVSEGDRSPTATPPRIIQPFIREITPAGVHVREYTIPTMFTIGATESGPRGNAVFEGLTFTPDGSTLAVIMEGARYEDGAPPTLTAGARTRITLYDRAQGTAKAQYGFDIDPIQATPVPDTAFSVNGNTEILALSATRFLVLQRSFSVGVVGNQVRLYEIDLADADDVLDQTTLAAGVATASKRLVLDFQTLAASLGGIANLEGITFGRQLANGNRSLVVVADDNFPAADSTTDRNQILVFEVLP